MAREQRRTAKKPLAQRLWKRVCTGMNRVIGNTGPKDWRYENILAADASLG